ncbi:MAG: hypothetical protein OHK93_004392 [Ramalina farinacea]|uniref:FMN hydroxy acid dehydrogenase domain-containing protein n=1 Tax=Ramalina farinacea TaxID=258253 RepID=A0AA43QU31_9LECA|nr:hypothetical protein [Ramalina farinacea]
MNPSLLEAQARKHVGERSFHYAAGGAGERSTMEANWLAFRQWKIIPRMLRPVSVRDLSTTLFGQRVPSPILIAPIGVQAIFHSDAESGVASVAEELGLPFMLSTASSTSIEDVAVANGATPTYPPGTDPSAVPSSSTATPDHVRNVLPNRIKQPMGTTSQGGGIRYFQLYWPQDPALTQSILNRAKSNGYSVLVVTLDTWTLGYRPADLDNAYVPFVRGQGCEIGFSDPVFRPTPENSLLMASQSWIATAFSGQAHTWADLRGLREMWGNAPMVLKGIQSVDDAELAVEYGMDGIIVSNHGGRQVDGCVGSLEVLPEIVEAVGEKVTVLFDSGVRTGVDVLKALCLGARGVCVGRPWVYGMCVAGRAGVREVLRGLLCDLDQSMGLAGIGDVGGCGRGVLRRCRYPGDRIANL